MVHFSDRMGQVDASFSKFVGCSTNAIDLSVGIPGFDTPDHIKEAAIGSMKKSSVNYVGTKGSPELRQLISEMYKEKYGVDCSPDNVMISFGGKGAIFALMQSIVNPGDNVLIQDPGWLSYSEITKIAGGTPVSVKAHSENEFIEGIESNADVKTKMAIYSSTANPTGEMYNGKGLKRLSEIASDKGFLIASDEPYHEIVFDGKKHVSVGKHGLENTVIINSFSKTFCMSGWRIGYAIAAKEIIDVMGKFQLHQGTCIPSFVQAGAIQALKHDWTGVEKRKRSYEGRRNLFCKSVRKRLGAGLPEGTFYYFPSVERFGLSGEEFSSQLNELGVLTVPGGLFGENGKNNVRFTFTKTKAELGKAADITNEFVESLN